MKVSESVVAHYLGGPKDDTREIVGLQNGAPPHELRCVEPPSHINVTMTRNDRIEEPLPVGIYWLKGATKAPDYEGLPGAQRWVEAVYHWHGWR